MCVALFLLSQASFCFLPEQGLRFEPQPLFLTRPVQLLNLSADASFLFGPGACILFNPATKHLQLGMFALIFVGAAPRFFLDSSRFLVRAPARLFKSSALFFVSAVTGFNFKLASFFLGR